MIAPQLNVILLGAPIAGKGTQAERIAARFGVPHISTGEMLRAAVSKGTEMGRVVQQLMEAGELVPDEVVTGVVRERLVQPDAQDGFPGRVPANTRAGEAPGRDALGGRAQDQPRPPHRRS